jgi:small subunit ribosomal protein S1
MDQNDTVNRQDSEKEQSEEVENVLETVSMESLMESSGVALDLPRQGEVRRGVIASVAKDEVLVSIGSKSEGVIPARELEQLTEEDRAKLIVGDEISVYVVSPENQYGTLILSYTRALEEDDWNHAEEIMSKNEVFQGEVEGYNKGGLILRMGRLRGFIPASQISLSRRTIYRGDTPEQRWGKMVGELMVARIIEVDRQRRRLILSEKAASHESRETLKERLLEELKEGEFRTGRVTSLADFGAFVNINGADGLVHLSEISWDRINHPSEVLKVGQEVQVKVISIDRDRRRIGLSIRQLQDDPWTEKVSIYKVGQLVDGTITRLAKFGAFARITDEMEGLIHISELSDRRIEHPKEVVSEGDHLTLRIIKIDNERRRVGLSLRKVDSLAYSDLDWEMALAEIEEMDEVETGTDTEPEEGVTVEAETVAEVETEDVEVETEDVEVEVEEIEAKEATEETSQEEVPPEQEDTPQEPEPPEPEEENSQEEVPPEQEDTPLEPEPPEPEEETSQEEVPPEQEDTPLEPEPPEPEEETSQVEVLPEQEDTPLEPEPPEPEEETDTRLEEEQSGANQEA